MKHLSYFLLILLLLSVPSIVLGQSAGGGDISIAQTLTIQDEEAVSGDIVSLTDNPETLARSTKEFDERMYGVLNEDPLVVYTTTDDIPVVRSGIVTVNVTTQGGAIAVGDYITSSDIPGKGKKAEGVSGNMLGLAVTGFDGSSGEEGTVKVQVGIGPASPVTFKATGGLFGTLKQLQTALLFNINSSRTTDRIIRYILAGLLAVLIIGLGYYTFGRQITKGIEAIGRNPLAKASIQTMIVLNAVLLVVVCLGGIILALSIISL